MIVMDNGRTLIMSIDEYIEFRNKTTPSTFETWQSEDKKNEYED